MAITITAVLAGANIYIADVESDNNADVSTGNMAHGLGAIPLEAELAPLHVNFYASQWRVTTLDITNIVVTKTAPAGGVAANQMRVIVRRPFRMVQ